MSELKEPETQFVCMHPEGCRMVIAVKDSAIPDESWKPQCPNCKMTMYRVSMNKEMLL